ncbi:MAG: hypothetical protein ACM3NT_10580, partial [Methylocystaceae bacterium]
MVLANCIQRTMINLDVERVLHMEGSLLEKNTQSAHHRVHLAMAIIVGLAATSNIGMLVKNLDQNFTWLMLLSMLIISYTLIGLSWLYTRNK